MGPEEEEEEASVLSESDLCSVLIDVGVQLLAPSENMDEILELLNDAEALLTVLRQERCSSAVRDAFLPIKKGLISDKLFRHVNMDVRVSVLSCIHQLLRLTAPKAPYENDVMKVIFQQTLIVLEKNLTLFSGSYYKKALQILETSAKVRSCVILLDIGCEPLVIQMFQILLDNIRPAHPESVFTNMEHIMTRLIHESDELSLDLLKPLLTSVKKENQTISPLSWSLGMKVLKNCSPRVKPYLIKAAERMRLDAENYTDIAASICPDAFVEDNVMKDAAVHASDLVQMSGDGILEKSKDYKCESMDGDFSKSLVCCEPGILEKSKDYQCEAIDGDFTKVLVCCEPVQSAPLQVIANEPAQSAPLQIIANEPAQHEPEAYESGESVLRSKRRGGRTSSEVSRKRKNNGKLGGSSKREKPSSKSKSSPSDQSSQGSGQPKKVTIKNEVLKNEVDSGNDCKIKLKTTAQNFSAEESLLRSFKGSDLEEYGEELIGSRVKVWWPDDREFYTGTVESYDPSRKKHKVMYEDGDVEHLSLKKERWFLLDDIATKQDQDVEPQNSSPVPVKSEKKKVSPQKEHSAKEEITDSRSKKKESTSSSKKRLPHPQVKKCGTTSMSMKAEVVDTSANKGEKTLRDIIRYTRRPKPERASPDSLELLSKLL